MGASRKGGRGAPSSVRSLFTLLAGRLAGGLAGLNVRRGDVSHSYPHRMFSFVFLLMRQPRMLINTCLIHDMAEQHLGLCDHSRVTVGLKVLLSSRLGRQQFESRIFLYSFILSFKKEKDDLEIADQ